MDNSIEIWKDIEGFSGYKVSNFGKVVSFKKENPCLLKLKTTKGAIPCVFLSEGRKREYVKLSVLVARAFVPRLNDKNYVHFKNGDLHDCRAENLYWSDIIDEIPCDKGEIWKDVKGYEGMYKVSSYGRVYSLTRERFNAKEGRIYKGRMLKPNVQKYGYKCAALLSDGEHKLKKIHRLVAEAFIPNPDNKPTVDHIDGNPSNNRVDNLRWATVKENINNPLTLCHKYGKVDLGKNPMATPVYGIDILTGERLDFDCIESADRFLGVKYPRYIGLCCRGKWKSYKGYYWHYA